jgi:hypothetical protein
MREHLIILIPVYEDWSPLRLLLKKIEQSLHNSEHEISVLIVDDASPTQAPEDLFETGHAIADVRIVRLKLNVGHQRAIAIGLSYLQANLSPGSVVIMDADGEDLPEDISRLLQRSAEAGEKYVVFAERAVRTESVVFRIFYWLYRVLFRISTGRRIRFGNFSLIPPALLSRIVALPDVWNNYAASLVKARLPLQMVSCSRGPRLMGKSKMGLVGLILHGLSAISVHSEVFGARALIASSVVMLVALMLACVATVIRLTTDLAIPGWATYAVGLSIIGVLQGVTLTVFFVFLILHSRNTITFVPGRDYEYFIEEVGGCTKSDRSVYD